jgi:hypothetical protein
VPDFDPRTPSIARVCDYLGQWRAGWPDLPTLPFRTRQAICGVGRTG